MQEQKNIEYICHSFEINPLSGSSTELTASLYAIKSDKLQILVKSLKFGKEKFVELANVTIMGEPQMVTYNGMTDVKQRGNTLVFKNYLDVSDWSVFGSSAGQGLILDFVNPFNEKLKVSIVLKGFRSSSDKLGSK